VSEFHERLQSAIFRKYETIEEAASAMDVPGASYPNLTRLVRGAYKRTPSAEFVAQIAERLDVRFEWLPPRQIGEMLRADFDAMGREPTTMTPEELDDYLLIRFGAMLSAISYPRSSVIW